MRPNDLKTSFTWEERRPLIEDRVFHVPLHYYRHHEFTFPGWEDGALFGNDHPVHIEYCAGNGEWIAERAKKYPEKNWVAVEIRFDRVRKIWAKIKNENLPNLFVVMGEGVTFTKHYLADASVEEVFVNFPDPWPKGKHKKHRLMTLSFIEELHRILQVEKRATFVTDDVGYLAPTIDIFLRHPGFKPVFSSPYFTTDLQDYGSSWFETLWREKGRSICYTQFHKRDL
jgi:tRNA (guanine-N7-)-methyltransferase